MSRRTCSVEGCGRPHHSRGYCGTHYQSRRLRGELPVSEKTPRGIADGVTEKTCAKCRRVLPLTEFHRSSLRLDGLGLYCKPCMRAYNRDYVKRNPEANAARARKSRIKRYYGITWEQRDGMVADQGGRCAICRNPFASSKDTHVDHCHATGTVRAILCYNCNSGLGNFKDDPIRLKAAIEYLLRWAEVKSGG